LKQFNVTPIINRGFGHYAGVIQTQIKTQESASEISNIKIVKNNNREQVYSSEVTLPQMSIQTLLPNVQSELQFLHNEIMNKN